ncbi:hypothetical protein NPIL_633501, partial [Nephila pilipes]
PVDDPAPVCGPVDDPAPVCGPVDDPAPVCGPVDDPGMGSALELEAVVISTPKDKSITVASTEKELVSAAAIKKGIVRGPTFKNETVVALAPTYEPVTVASNEIESVSVAATIEGPVFEEDTVAIMVIDEGVIESPVPKEEAVNLVATEKDAVIGTVFEDEPAVSREEGAIEGPSFRNEPVATTANKIDTAEKPFEYKPIPFPAAVRSKKPSIQNERNFKSDESSRNVSGFKHVAQIHKTVVKRNYEAKQRRPEQQIQIEDEQFSVSWETAPRDEMPICSSPVSSSTEWKDLDESLADEAIVTCNEVVCVLGVIFCCFILWLSRTRSSR